MKLTEEQKSKIAQILIEQNELDLVNRFFESQVPDKKPNCNRDEAKRWIFYVHRELREKNDTIPDDVLDFIRDSALRAIEQ